MQAWNQVKVKNDKSAHFGRAGMVVRVEGAPGGEIAAVRLDEDDVNAKVVENFDCTELELL